MWIGLANLRLHTHVVAVSSMVHLPKRVFISDEVICIHSEFIYLKDLLLVSEMLESELELGFIENQLCVHIILC